MQKGSQYIGRISLVFFLLAVSFLLNMWGKKKIVVIRHPFVSKRFLTNVPVNQANLKPVMQKYGFPALCHGCHNFVQPSGELKTFSPSHDDIILKHGHAMNCLTCHNLKDRDVLVGVNGEEISFSQSQLLCYRCHGLRYRDWEKGAHGRINGYWDETKGEKRKLTCVECHDPHQPKFRPMEPAPPPSLTGK